jgi:Pyruvate/2-oxoacid:ferredoxin oxidoreductase gamma subunit
MVDCRIPAKGGRGTRLTSSMLIKAYSVLETLGTSMLWVEGEMSSSFFWVKIWERGSFFADV